MTTSAPDTSVSFLFAQSPWDEDDETFFETNQDRFFRIRPILKPELMGFSAEGGQKAIPMLMRMQGFVQAHQQDKPVSVALVFIVSDSRGRKMRFRTYGVSFSRKPTPTKGFQKRLPEPPPKYRFFNEEGDDRTVNHEDLRAFVTEAIERIRPNIDKLFDELDRQTELNKECASCGDVFKNLDEIVFLGIDGSNCSICWPCFETGVIGRWREGGRRVVRKGAGIRTDVATTKAISSLPDEAVEMLPSDREEIKRKYAEKRLALLDKIVNLEDDHG